MSSSNVIPLPTKEEAEEAKEISRNLALFSNVDRVKVSAVTENGDVPEELILPGKAIQFLLHIMTQMSKGNAVNIMPIHAELSTQEAANILNVSRPYFVNLLEKGEIAHHKVGSHRRVKAKDVFEYKDAIDKARKETLNQLSQQAQELGGMGYE